MTAYSKSDASVKYTLASRDFDKKLKQLSEASIFFLKNSSQKDIFPYVANKLHILTNASVIVSEYIPETDSIIVRSVSIKKAERSKIKKIIGKNIIDLDFKFQRSIKSKFISGRLSKVKGGIYQLSFYRIPKKVCLLIENILKVEEIFSMAFVTEKNLLGTVSIITQNKQVLHDKRIVEAFINQAAVALKNKKTKEELNKTMASLEKEKELLIETERKKDEFIGIASHELKTPLTSVKVYAELLNKDLPSKDGIRLKRTSHFLSNLLRELAKIEKLVNDMLSVSKIEKGKLIFEMKKFDLNKLLVETVNNYQLTINSHKIIFKSNFKSRIIADEVRLQQAVINLLNNAVKYSPKADKVLVSLKEINNKAVVSVKDWGTGISKQYTEKIFEQYYRIDGKRGKQGGFGLGLYITSEIVKRHGGKIWVNSRLGYGSTFYFSLPLAKT